MFRNYFKISRRNLLRHPSYSSINVLGLAVGIASCILIMLYVRSEFSYDRWNAKADRIYRVWQREKADGKEFINTVTPIPAGPAISATFPEAEATCRIYAFNTMIQSGSNSFNEGFTMVDSTLFSIFDFRLLQGDRKNPFPNSHSLIVTPEIARKYFGDGDAMGKTLLIQLGDKQQPFSITGIAEPAPEESSIKFELLIPYSNDVLLFNPRMMHNWFNVFNETYVLLHNRSQLPALVSKFPSMVRQQLGADYGKEEFDLYLQPLTSIHLDNSLPAAIQPTSNPKYSYILTTIGLLILLVACVNFITLSIGRSTTRAVEVGVRKALGAQRQQLIRQFWGEAVMLTVVSVTIGMALATVALHPFNQLIGKSLTMRFDPLFILFCFLLLAAIALAAGIYPAFILSGFNPVEVLKGRLNLKDSAGLFRKGLVVGQFLVSIVMIVCTLVVSKQMSYLRTRDLGYNKDQVIIVPTNKRRVDGFALAQLYRTELSKYPQVLSVSASTFSFAETPWAVLGFSDEQKRYHSFMYNEIDRAFLPTMQIRVLQGRGFERGNPGDSNSSILVNEALVKEYGLKDPVGSKFGKYTQQIVGVVHDFNYESLHEKIKPLVLSLKFDTMARQSSDLSFSNAPQPRVSVRMKAGDMQANIDILKQAWHAVAPRQDFEYRFLDERLASAYAQETKSAIIVKIASGLSIFIACMGLFGLVTGTVSRRTKEIGIRKVLGASPGQLVQLLSRDFLLLVGVAAVIAFPVSWWAMNSWLSDFAYRTDITWWIFLIAAMAAVLIVLLTISFQTIRAALTNPVKALRTE